MTTKATATTELCRWVGPLGVSSNCGVLSIIHGLVSHVRFLAPYSGLDVLRLAECCLRDTLMLMELHRMLTNERVGMEPGAAEVGRLKNRVHAAEEDSKSLRVAHVRVNELTAERAWLGAENEQSKLSKTFWMLVFASWNWLQRHSTES